MLEDAEEAIAAQSRRRVCGFTQWVETLTHEDRERATSLLADRSYTCRALARYFATKGAALNDQVLSRHRNGKCCGQ